ncbi:MULTISPECIES: cory-CC-star protein [unclassified Iodidimonas]|jgi:hypothetical protein|uniref:cory-CC-star protein n=1 Tax=unclassified Iodidimonas TaxID=2626145 RepID=UPI0024821BDE|nr:MULTISPECIES: cory-CC-star protein [unclassified Iodidimonas]
MADIMKRLHHAHDMVSAWLDQYYNAPYRSAVGREARSHRDIIMTTVFLESLGLPNPAHYYTLELMPLMIQDFHDWHRRMGMDHSPFDHIRCC